MLKETSRKLIHPDVVFIVGFPRSGTTYLQSLLCTQEDFWSLPETHFYTDIINFNKNRGEERDDYVAGQIKKWLGINLDQKLIESSLNNHDEKLLFDAILSIYNDCHLGVDIKEKRLIEKTPYHFLFIDRFLKIYPKAKFLGIVRNPLEVADSYVKNLTSYFSDFKKLAHEIKQCFEILEKYEETGVLQVIRFEDLVDNNRVILDKVSAFLNFKLDESELSNYTQKSKQLKMSFEPWKEKNTVKLKEKKNKVSIPLEDQLFIQSLNKEYFHKYGYPIKCKSLGRIKDWISAFKEK